MSKLKTLLKKICRMARIGPEYFKDCSRLQLIDEIQNLYRKLDRAHGNLVRQHREDHRIFAERTARLTAENERLREMICKFNMLTPKQYVIKCEDPDRPVTLP